ncbi:MAG: hypothetical protein HYR73_09590 [Candidatus Eisenbacteria bacterium]|nr:hypothetical protein [Candidatus Eisenbacteria bacterium]
MAFVPNAAQSTIPCGIRLVGSNALHTVADASGDFTITIKDVGGNVIQNSAIVIDFSGCCNDLQLSTSQAGAGVTQVGKTIHAVTNGSGQVTLRIQGASDAKSPYAAPYSNNPPVPGTPGCATISADGVLISDGISHQAVRVATFDEDGVFGGNGIGAADLSILINDSFNATYFQRSDFDGYVTCTFGIGGIGATDLSQLIVLSFSPNMVSNGLGYTGCP